MKIKSNTHSIFSIEAKTYDLSGVIDNDNLEKSILDNSHLKFSSDPTDTRYEDSYIPETTEFKKLLKIIDKIANLIIPGILRDKKDMPWGHICKPGQQTRIHAHSSYEEDNPHGVLSWCYYVKMPVDGGNLIFPMYFPLFKESFFEVIPKTSGLIFFPGWANHLTTLNGSNENRISISGNYYIKNEHLENLSHEDTLKLCRFMSAPSIDINRLTIKM